MAHISTWHCIRGWVCYELQIIETAKQNYTAPWDIQFVAVFLSYGILQIFRFEYLHPRMRTVCYTCISFVVCHRQPITVASRSKAWNLFAYSNTGIVGSNPTQAMDSCLRLFCVCVRQRPNDGLIPRPRRPTDCLRLRNCREMRISRMQYSPKWEQQE
jgi:hypothetical protein